MTFVDVLNDVNGEIFVALLIEACNTTCTCLLLNCVVF